MFTIVKKTPNNNDVLEIQIMVEPKNKVHGPKSKKYSFSDLKHRLNSAFGGIEKDSKNDESKPLIESYKGIVFKDIPAIKPQHPNLANINDYPDKIFLAINHKKFHFEYVVLEGDISPTAIGSFIKRIEEVISENEKIKKIVLRLLSKECLEELKNISFAENIIVSIEHNEEILTWAKEILSAKENIEYHVYGKVNTSEEMNKPISDNKTIHKKSLKKTSSLDNQTPVAAEISSGRNDPVKDQIDLEENYHKENSSPITNQLSVLNNQSFDAIEDSHHTDDEEGSQLLEKETQQLTTEANKISGLIAAPHQLKSNSNNQRNLALKITTSPELSINAIKEYINKLEPEIEKFRSQIKKLQEETNSLEHENKTLKSQNNDLVEENHKLKQMEVYAAVISPSSSSNVSLFNQLITHAASAETLRAENHTLRNNNSAMTDEINHLKYQKNQALADNETLRAENSRLNAFINDLETSCSMSKAQNEELGKLLEQERARIGYLTKLLSSNNLVNNMSSQFSNTNNDCVTPRKRPHEDTSYSDDTYGEQQPVKSAKLTPASSPGNNNRSTFWSPSNSSANQRGYVHTEQVQAFRQLPAYHFEAAQKTMVEPTSYNYPSETERRERLPLQPPHAVANNSYIQQQGSGIESNNNAVPADNSILLNNVFSRPSNSK